jgi:two-component system nitrogen regulation sensor histidine kinase NtrY
MLAIILVSFIVTGITAINNYRRQNQEYHEARLQRKEEAVNESLDYYLMQQGGHIPQDSIVMVFSDKICELSDIHNLPINLFNLEGELVISSNSQMFSEQGIPDQIDYTILKQLSTGNNRAVIEKELAGNKYLLAYWYFRSDDGKPIAITNVPYFETEDINTDELEDFLSGLSTVYLILFIAASILAYFLSNYITKSLQSIAARLRTVDISRKNEPIEWKGDDEIGALVHEYNRMLKEAEKSAEHLARSERESAWREMAKQVAHEIKNPLTPMKLRVQHLLRAWEDKSPDFDAKLNRVAETLIEQIDTLSNIATEFSNFANMPKANNEKTDLVPVIKSTLELFENSDSIKIESSLAVNQAYILCDKDQIIRVFTNLIKNSIQAIPPNKNGVITVSLEEEKERYCVKIQDNGSGISEAQKSKIFTPNFTTKSTGTGLGLAMVHGIMTQSGRSIHFDSEPNKGTCFYLYFPKY